MKGDLGHIEDLPIWNLSLTQEPPMPPLSKYYNFSPKIVVLHVY